MQLDKVVSVFNSKTELQSQNPQWVQKKAPYISCLIAELIGVQIFLTRFLTAPANSYVSSRPIPSWRPHFHLRWPVEMRGHYRFHGRCDSFIYACTFYYIVRMMKGLLCKPLFVRFIGRLSWYTLQFEKVVIRLLWGIYLASQYCLCVCIPSNIIVCFKNITSIFFFVFHKSF